MAEYKVREVKYKGGKRIGGFSTYNANSPEQAVLMHSEQRELKQKLSRILGKKMI